MVDRAIDHVARLLAEDKPSQARRVCDEYLQFHDDPVLRVQRAEASSAMGDHAAALEDVARARSSRLTADDSARLLRVEGLAAADRGDLDVAERKLAEARQIYFDAGDDKRASLIDQDRLAVLVPQPSVEEAGPPRTVADHLMLSKALKRELRYDEALQVLLRLVAEQDVDPALRFPVLQQITALLWLTRQDDRAVRLRDMLEEAAAQSPDPVAAQEELARLFPDGGSVAPGLEQVRRLVVEQRLDEAERMLVELRSAPRVDVATWHLTAGELELARYHESGEQQYLKEAVGQLRAAAEHADTIAYAELRVFALRLAGRAYSLLEEDDLAAEHWVEAHRIEEHFAERQVTDELRVRMLLSAPDEHDERVRAAADAVERHGSYAKAAVVVAMEAARGSTLLGPVRELPRLSDLDGSWLWLADVTRGLPRSQVVWMMHATPHRVHHAIVGRDDVRVFAVDVDLITLTESVDDLMSCWSKDFLELSIASGEFDEYLTAIAGHIDIDAVMSELPRHVTRIAIVAGGVLGDVPFAALLGNRFALSDLPCLSAHRPLQLQSAVRRGDDTLLVSPPDDTLTAAKDMPGRKVLKDSNATPQRLQADVERLRPQKIRIDSHGVHDPEDPAKSWLQLAPPGPLGQLRPEELRRMDLRTCGTVVLGACESGMAQRRGRDERVGFARAAVNAGAASVVAARWVAGDEVAAAVLDRFERNLLFLPRDVALHRAQLEAPEHPGLWACWTLYGDSGWQTSAGPVRRWLRRTLDERRNRAPSR